MLIEWDKYFAEDMSKDALDMIRIILVTGLGMGIAAGGALALSLAHDGVFADQKGPLPRPPFAAAVLAPAPDDKARPVAGVSGNMPADGIATPPVPSAAAAPVLFIARPVARPAALAARVASPVIAASDPLAGPTVTGAPTAYAPGPSSGGALSFAAPVLKAAPATAPGQVPRAPLLTNHTPPSTGVYR